MDRDINDYFREITQDIYSEVEEKLQKYGLVKGQAQLLLIIRDNEGCTQKDLANYFNVKYSSMSERINKLESSGFITRVHEDGNFKNNRIYITPEGKQASTQARKILKDIDTKLYKGISKKDLAMFEKTLIKMIDNLN
jgi:DNA-binding MarR family transcriptional regulator